MLINNVYGLSYQKIMFSFFFVFNKWGLNGGRSGLVRSLYFFSCIRKLYRIRLHDSYDIWSHLTFVKFHTLGVKKGGRSEVEESSETFLESENYGEQHIRF